MFLVLSTPRIIGQKQCHSVDRRILFEIARMQSVNPRIAASFYASVMKVLKVRPVVRRKKGFHRQISATGTTRYYDNLQQQQQVYFKLNIAYKACARKRKKKIV